MHFEQRQMSSYVHNIFNLEKTVSCNPIRRQKEKMTEKNKSLKLFNT